MKKKFITKLILSGAALAASAATLVSTTYAWYVQNTQVTATGVSGAVKDNGASSIYISKDYVLATPNAATWLPTVEFVAGDHVQGITISNNQEVYNEAAAKDDNKVYNGGLDPITLDDTLANSGKFVDVAGHEKVTVTGATNANAFVYKAEARVIEFNLYVQANVETQIRPYLIIENTTTSSTIKTQTAFRNVENGDADVAQGGQFWIDAVQALRMQVIVEKANGTSSWDAVSTNTSNGIYDVLKIAKKSYTLGNNPAYAPYDVVTSIDGVANTVKFLTETNLGTEDFYVKTQDTTVVAQKQYYSDNAGTTATPATANPKTEGLYEKQCTLSGANAYYRALTGAIPTGTFAERAIPENVTTMNKTTIAKDTAYKFTFRIWLEGTDPACFDSCVKQTFNIGINFDVENA